MGTDLGAFCSWWPSQEISIGAIHTRYLKKSQKTNSRRRRTTQTECLKAPPGTTQSMRTTGFPDYFLVDHTSPKGGIPYDFACPGYEDYVPNFEKTWANWVGCSHNLFPDWTGYVCQHPGTGEVALECFSFRDIPGCDLNENMPCPPKNDDFGCRGGLMPGESCTHECSKGMRSTAFPKTQNRCPLQSPNCVTVCGENNIPVAPEWAPFWLSWDWNLQESVVLAKSKEETCTPAKLSCGQRFSLVRCRPKTCGSLSWAGINGNKKIGTVISPVCPSGQRSGAPVVTCGLDGKWSHEQNACQAIRSTNIVTERSECIHNERIITKTVLDPGFPPIVQRGVEKWVESCVSPLPECCPNQGLHTSFGYYTLRNEPKCHCSYAHLGFQGADPCCSFHGKINFPTLVFFSSYRGNLKTRPCEGKLCSAASCYSHPLGCLAFNETHMATWAPTLGELKNAFSWEF